jgi:mediator of RNA polymerase II transcription subunit 10
MAAAAEEEGKAGLNRFEALEQSIEQFIESTRQIGIIVSDFQPGSQGVLNQKM